MIGLFLSRGLVMVFGYVYPAYECYKSVELNKPDIDQLRFWCQYWVLVAGLTVFERLGDTFMGWVPMYGEAKLAFFVYLWYPKTKGTTYVYDSFFRPYIAKHEPEIDRSLFELKTRAADIAVLYWQKSAIYAQTRVFDILQFVAAQSTPRKPAEPPRKETESKKPDSPPASRADESLQTRDEELSSTTASKSSSDEEETKEEAIDSKANPATVVVSEEEKTTQILDRSSEISSSSKEPIMQIDSAKETVAEAGRLTRARSRKTRVASSR